LIILSLVSGLIRISYWLREEDYIPKMEEFIQLALYTYNTGLWYMTTVVSIPLIVNWFSRKEGYFMTQIYFTAVTLTVLTEFVVPYQTINIIAGVLLLTVCPLFLWVCFIYDPLDKGIIINESASLMNSYFLDDQWTGKKLE
jgi:hypothetical protein